MEDRKLIPSNPEEEEKIKVSDAIEVVLMHLIESEMGEKIDVDDSWYPIYCELRELLEKVEDADEVFGHEFRGTHMKEYTYYYHDNGELIAFEDVMHDLRNRELVIETILEIDENRVEITFQDKEQS